MLNKYHKTLKHLNECICTIWYKHVEFRVKIGVMYRSMTNTGTLAVYLMNYTFFRLNK